MLSSLVILPLLLSLFFWIRGNVRWRQSDLIAGITLLLVWSAFLLVTGHAGLGFFGAQLAIFGLCCAVLSCLPSAKRHRTTQDLRLAAVAFVLLGLSMSLIL